MLISILPTDDQERASLLEFLAGSVVEDGAYILADVEQAQAELLRKKGVLFNREESAIATDSAAPASAGDSEITVLSDDGGAMLESTDEEGDADADSPGVLHVAGPLSAERLAWLADHGIGIRSKIGPNAYLSDMARDEVNAIAQDAGWLHVSQFGRTETLGPELDSMARTRLENAVALSGALESSGGDIIIFDDSAVTAPEIALYDLRCSSPAKQATTVLLLQTDTRVLALEQGLDRIRLQVAAGSLDEASLLGYLGRNSSVLVVEKYAPPELLLNYAVAALLGKDDPGTQPVLQWTGKGEIIAIADSGIDALHPDLEGRVETVELVSPASARDPLGHGTHVASIAVGDGKASGGRLRAAAWESRLFVQSMVDGNLTMRFGIGLTEMLKQAYDAGARIINYSWGSSVRGRYTLDADDIDRFVYDNPDVLVVIAAGNSGEQDVESVTKKTGLRSLTSPAMAKNALAVGASCSPRKDGPYENLTWLSYDGSRPPQQPPLSNLSLTGDRNVVAAISSRGPSDDGRMKPDLVAAGIGIAGALAADHKSPRHRLDGSTDYHFLSGTSMAAPLVASAAALVRQFYRENRGHAPSAALLRATLINGCEWINANEFDDPRVGSPNFHQGFGRFNLLQAIPAVNDAEFALEFVDIASVDPKALDASKKDRAIARHKLVVNSGDLGNLSITLAWTDPPGRHIQHDLDLVLISPDGTRTVGNKALRRLEFEEFDSVNNVEQVRVAAAEPGDWIIVVSAKNTFRSPQGYALAIAGNV